MSGTQELALLDLRDVGSYGYGGPLNGIHLPADISDAAVCGLLPRCLVPIVLIDDDGGPPVQVFAERLAALGYANVHILAGGLAAWTASGSTTRLHATSRELTRDILSEYRTPTIAAAEAMRLRAAGHDVLVLDMRPGEEYARGHIPGARHVPGGELLYRYDALVSSPDTVVFTSCGGLPRAVVGAQTLIEAGVPNRVEAIHEGTKGWQEAGGMLETGFPHSASEPMSLDRTRARALAAQLLKSQPLAHVDAATIDAWRRDPARTTYLVDLRTSEEIASHPFEGAIEALGAQLAVGAHRHLAVRGARLVLLDDDGVRAATAARWLRRRGWETWRHALS